MWTCKSPDGSTWENICSTTPSYSHDSFRSSEALLRIGGANAKKELHFVLCITGHHHTCASFASWFGMLSSIRKTSD